MWNEKLSGDTCCTMEVFCIVSCGLDRGQEELDQSTEDAPRHKIDYTHSCTERNKERCHVQACECDRESDLRGCV